MTDIDIHPGAIHRGRGVVARWPGVVAVIPADPVHQQAVEEMFAELGASPDPADVVRAIRELTIDQTTLQAVGYVMAATGGPVALAHGPVELLVDGVVALSGAGGPNETQITSGDRISLRLTDDPEASAPVAPFDLRRGIAPGAGITLGPVDDRASAQPTPPPLDPPTASSPSLTTKGEEEPARVLAPFNSVLLFELDPTTLTERNPLPVAAVAHVLSEDVTSERPAGIGGDVASGGGSGAGGSVGLPIEAEAPPVAAPQPWAEPPVAAPVAAPAVEPALAETVDPPAAPTTHDGRQVFVDGIVCSRDHFNNPAAAFCMVCGISMVHVTHNLVPGPRPTLGFVVFDDGSTFGLDRSYLIGREPGESDDALVATLTIQDNNETLSRRHAELRLIDWTVHVVDLQSTNGTFIWDTTSERWNQVVPHQPTPLNPGDTVALGRRTFVYESVTRL